MIRTHQSHNNGQTNATSGRPVTALEESHANISFEHFLTASTLKTILGTYRNICEYLHLKPNVIPQFYPKLKAHVNSWKAKPLWKKFDYRANQKCYGRGRACPNTRVLIIGAGPCGLRSAIEAQLLGAKVVVVEKRDRMSRNNVLHLWPFVIEDLRMLGAKKFFGKFCAGAIDHISIRQLQCILMKVALLLGVEIHTEVSFERLIEPNLEDKIGWRAEFKPADHPVSQFEFDVVLGADGKRNTLHGFKRKEFRGKLAIAITANFINKRTEAEARVEEISGVAFIFNQKFFKDLYADTGIDLENIVYYKDDTHYFVMTAKKQSLIEKSVIKKDVPDTARLLAPDNVDREELMNYAREAAEFSTNYQMPDLEFAVNHYGQPDVAMFDFTSMYAAENASRVIERHGYKLLSILVGDSLLEPFWPTGSGCARGFLSSMDAAWAIRSWGSGHTTPLEVLSERESIYRLLAQTTPENLNKDYKSYMLDPSTRYPNLNRNVLSPHQVTGLYDTDDPKAIELKPRLPPSVIEVPKKRRRRESHVDPDTLLSWIKSQVREHADLEVTDITSSFKDGQVLCAILHHYRPDLLDYSAIPTNDAAKNNQLAFDLLEQELGIPPVMTAQEIEASEVPDYLKMLSYLTQIYDTFRCEIPHIKHPKLDLPDNKRCETVVKLPTGLGHEKLDATGLSTRPLSRHKRHIDVNSVPKPIITTQDRKTRKRKTLEKVGASVEERQKRLEDIASNRFDRQNKRRQQRKNQTEQFIKSMQMLQANCKPDHSEPFEDYSIFLYRQTAPNFEDRVKDLEKMFTYVPDRENRLLTQTRRETDEDFAARIKDLEDKWRDPVPVEKKPKDLLRAIGKIETSDWNIKEIEKKIIENKVGKAVNKDKEKVPKWSREQFLARQNKMERQHLERQESSEMKFAEIDKNIKQLEQRLKEGSTRDLNQQKVATITEKFGKPIELPPQPQPKPLEKSNSRAMVLPSQGSEHCHFCSKRVYLMERLSAEGKFFHRGCFRCQYCHTLLRLGSYMFDREGLHGKRFYCTQHYGMPGELRANKVDKKDLQEQPMEIPETKLLTSVIGVDLLDRVQTPERIEFSNLSTGHISSDHEESPSPIDEDEWTDRNFKNSVIDSDSPDDSSSSSDSNSDDDEAFEEALEEPATKEGTLKWAERYKKRYSRKHYDEIYSDEYSSSDDSSYCENSSGDEESDTATEGEEEIRARELRKQEVRVEPPVTDTGTDTEVKPLSNLIVEPIVPNLSHNQKSSNLDIPDILKSNDNNTLNISKSSDNMSVNSTEFNSAESELDELYNTEANKNNDIDINKNKLNETNLQTLDLTNKLKLKSEARSISPSSNESKTHHLSKSATTSSMGSTKILRNFVLPPKDQRKSFGKDFVPTFKSTEAEPLLIIKRTPSKINLPPEVGKPKCVLKTAAFDPKKYFGETKKKPPISKPMQRKSDTPKPAALLIKQTSLPERKNVEDNVLNFNFEPEDTDLKDVDDYIENLLQNKDDLLKPVALNKPKSEINEDEVSSSIEDLLKALETETSVGESELVAIKPEEKMDDLLSWLEELDHQEAEAKAKSSNKYKNLEQSLKLPQKADSVISKLPKGHITLFENHMLGKNVDFNSDDEVEDKSKFQLTRSKTDVHCNKPRTSVDLDAVKKVDIKKVLRKFESIDGDEKEFKSKREIIVPKNIVKRNSFANFSFNRSFDKDDDTKYFDKPRYSIGSKDFKLKTEMFERKANNEHDSSHIKSISRSSDLGPKFGLRTPIDIRKFRSSSSGREINNEAQTVKIGGSDKDIFKPIDTFVLNEHEDKFNKNGKGAIKHENTTNADVNFENTFPKNDNLLHTKIDDGNEIDNKTCYEVTTRVVETINPIFYKMMHNTTNESTLDNYDDVNENSDSTSDNDDYDDSNDDEKNSSDNTESKTTEIEEEKCTAVRPLEEDDTLALTNILKTVSNLNETLANIEVNNLSSEKYDSKDAKDITMNQVIENLDDITKKIVSDCANLETELLQEEINPNVLEKLHEVDILNDDLKNLKVSSAILDGIEQGSFSNVDNEVSNSYKETQNLDSREPTDETSRNLDHKSEIIDSVNKPEKNNEIEQKIHSPQVPRRFKKESKNESMIPQRPIRQKSFDAKEDQCDREGKDLLEIPNVPPKIRSAGSTPVTSRRNINIITPPIPPLRKKSSASPILPKRNIINLSTPNLNRAQNNSNNNNSMEQSKNHGNEHKSSKTATIHKLPFRFKSGSAENISTMSSNKTNLDNKSNTKSKEKECCIQ